ncbi:MAG TPA: cation transporter [Rhodanobacteraceae bacterium]|nr:cation transporter [Rhodanobacteraceae bacterium]
MDTTLEQRVLKQSIVATAIVGTSCVVFGLWAGSRSIMFDGVYSLLDVFLTLGSLVVSRLVTSAGSRRFQYGYWHLEPLVLTFNSAMLCLLCVYALINGVDGLLGEGHAMEFEAGIAWVVVVGAACLALYFYCNAQARKLHSELLKLDAKGWLVSGALNMALLIAFALGALAEFTDYRNAGMYADSLVLVILALVMLPVPLSSCVRALREVLQIAPPDLDRRVREVLDAINAKHRFAGYRSHVARTGRIALVEVHFRVPLDLPIGSIRELDAVRSEIRASLHEPHVWLTVNFAGCDVEPMSPAASTG